MSATADVRTDQKAGWCSVCRSGNHGLCASPVDRCACPGKGHPNRPKTAPTRAAPLVVRTEVEVAADVVMALFDAELIGATLEQVAEVAAIPVAELRAAQERIRRRGYRGPVMRPTAPTAPPAVVPSPPVLRNANVARWHKKNPAPGLRTCSKCKATKPVADFDIKNQRTGQMKAWCRTCYRGYQRERYLTATEVGLVSNLRLLIEAGSPFLAGACEACGRSLVVGDEVEACDVTLRHTHCP